MQVPGLRLKKEKYEFLQCTQWSRVLCHTINAQGLKPSHFKISAIADAPVPNNVSELKSFLGLVNYYGKFLPTLASHLSPLYQLLNKKTKWGWERPQRKALNTVRDVLKSALLLAHFDCSLPLILLCDASPYGLGAVLSHKMIDNTEKPIVFLSHTLAAKEKTTSS